MVGSFFSKYNIGSNLRPMGAFQSSHSSYAGGGGLLGFIDEARLARQDNGTDERRMVLALALPRSRQIHMSTTCFDKEIF